MVSEKKGGAFGRAVELIGKIFGPVLPVLTAAGILKGVLALLSVLGLVSADAGVCKVLLSISDGFYYYLPVYLGFSGAKELGANPYTGATIAAAFLYPELTAIFTEKIPLDFLGIPVMPVTYQSGILPILMAVLLLSKVEPIFNKRVPELLRTFGVPLCSLLVAVPVTLLVFGPFGAVVGGVLASAYKWIYEVSPGVAGSLIGGLIQPMVICGFQWSLFPICLENIRTLGQDTLMPMYAPGVFAQAGAVFAVMMKERNVKRRAEYFSIGMTSVLGTTEPALFGCNLPLKTPFFCACTAAAIGGFLTGISGVTAKAVAFPGLATLPVYLGDGFLLFLFSNLLAFSLAWLFTGLFYKKENQPMEEMK